MHSCLFFIPIGRYIVIDVVKPISDIIFFILFIKILFEI